MIYKDTYVFVSILCSFTVETIESDSLLFAFLFLELKSSTTHSHILSESDDDDDDENDEQIKNNSLPEAQRSQKLLR